jgi:alanine racemase
MIFTLSYILKKINSKVYGTKREDFVVENLLFDSRRLNSVDGTIFFAIKTLSDNGQKYIAELYMNGVRVFVTESLPLRHEQYKDATFVVVEDTIGAMQEFAKIKRENFHNPIVAITGSNGKTIVKDWITQLIDKDLKVCNSPRSYNSQIGVALSLWNLRQNDDLGIIEAGISKKGEMQKLENIIKPTIGLITNIGDAHQVYFNTLQEKLQEKLILFKDANTIIYCKDNKEIHQAIISNLASSGKQFISWGFDKEATFKIEDIEVNNITTTIHYIYKNKKNAFTIPFIDKASIENAINAYIACVVVGIDKETLNRRTPNLESLEMRLEIKEGINDNLIINDSYSCDLTSLSIALNFVNQQKTPYEKVVILSDITQSFIDKTELYTQINKLLVENNIKYLVAIGKDFTNHKHLITIKHSTFLTTQDFIKSDSAKLFEKKIILIKGARQFGFEAISGLFEQKTHQTVLEINLSALAHNLNFFRSKLKENTKLMAMVKAHSYGSGGYEIAKLLALQHVDYLTVAFVDEGVELRNNGINLPIMVMSPEAKSITKILHYDLEPEIYSLSILKEFIDAKNHFDNIGNKKDLSIHLKIDTGMHRLGMEQKDIPQLLSLLEYNTDIKIKSIFSHLATADNPEFDNYTLKQIDTFKSLSQEIMQHFPYPILCHIANSAAISRFPEAQFDMVRLGIGMYGIGVDKNETKELQYVHSLKTILTLKREINENESVGYSRGFVSKKKMTIGVIPIGYADGLNRNRGNGRGKVWINQKLAPIIGNICMDMTMIDISEIDCKENDQVIIFGKEYPIENIAKELKTIVYEVLTNISQRVKRVFYQE